MPSLPPASVCFGLLAGGLSTRMGTDKSALPWQGVPLWQHQLRLAGEIGAAEILISGKANGPYRDAGRVIPDDVSGAGPLAGLSALLAAMASDWLLVAAVDMPLLNAVIFQEILAARGENVGVVPSLGGRPEPLAAVYPRAALPLAIRRMSFADRSLQSFVQDAVAAGLVRIQPWLPESAGRFRSLNTPDEFAAAQATLAAG